MHPNSGRRTKLTLISQRSKTPVPTGYGRLSFWSISGSLFYSEQGQRKTLRRSNVSLLSAFFVSQNNIQASPTTKVFLRATRKDHIIAELLFPEARRSTSVRTHSQMSKKKLEKEATQFSLQSSMETSDQRLRAPKRPRTNGDDVRAQETIRPSLPMSVRQNHNQEFRNQDFSQDSEKALLRVVHTKVVSSFCLCRRSVSRLHLFSMPSRRSKISAVVFTSRRPNIKLFILLEASFGLMRTSILKWCSRSLQRVSFISRHTRSYLPHPCDLKSFTSLKATFSVEVHRILTLCFSTQLLLGSNHQTI